INQGGAISSPACCGKRTSVWEDCASRPGARHKPTRQKSPRRARDAGPITTSVRPNGPLQQPLVGSSDAMHIVLADVESAALSDAKVLLTGETGVGKEVVARAVHQRSR